VLDVEPMNQHDRPYARHPSSHADLRTVARRAMTSRGLEPDFSDAALAQLKSMNAAAVSDDPAIKDMRDRLWCSIDNDDSLDLDQLSVCEPVADGAVKIFVAVADVDALVKRGTPIDAHAQMNTTSVYTAAQIFPMLPAKLSTDLSSLNQDVDRLAVVVEMTVGTDGAISDSDVYRATVRNRAKLAYNGVAAWLDGQGPAPAKVTAVAGMDEQIRVQDRVAHSLKKRRFESGALTLETVEARAVFEDGVLSDLVPEGRNRAKDLIEDFMIGANGVVARFLEAKKFPALRRVLKSPERWAKIVALAGTLGETLPNEPSNAALEAFLIKRRDAEPAKFADLSLSVVKLLGRGEYVLDLPGKGVEGHFGLALRDYTHSTAPNRRFPDVVTQRVLKAALSGGKSPYSNEDLAAIATHCTVQEDAATKVERQVRKSAAALLLSTHVGERFSAFVTGASSKGTWVRVSHPAAEGMLVRGADGLDVGDRVDVVLVDTNFERGFIDFARA
jgi:ribonuclease R